ncbi:MAG TPA: serine hydrolase domain-containing protein, partial [Lacunisphaera sp.]|nr:serine hydrolase domain-containing protein [Lacunisphaera sp.]
VGLSSEKLARIGPWLERLQAENKTPGAVTVVARRGQLVHFEAHGFADLENNRPMRTDAIFALASMSKPVAAVAVLLLMEEGKIQLDDPLEKFIPAFRDPRVAVARADAPGGYELIPANRSITIHDLLTHRPGFPGAPVDDRPAVKLWQEGKKGLTSDRATLAEYVDRIARLPLNSQPGTEWRYADGTLVLGRVIEIAADRPLDQFLQERIFQPLGMVDTGFSIPEDKLDRAAVGYARKAGQPLARNYTPAAVVPKLLSLSGGLYATAADYLRFCQMLLNGGELDGHRLLKRESVALMATAVVAEIPLPFLAGQGYGLAVAVLQPGGKSTARGSPGTYGWSGARNTYFRIDPQQQLILAIFQQHSPPNDLESTYGFQNLVMDAVTE